MNEHYVDKAKRRLSNIELLKVLAMLLICICHVITELTNTSYVPFNDVIVDWSAPSNNLVHVFLAIMHQWGYLGNTIFFFCSSWFLLQDDQVKMNKVISLLLDIEVISALFLIIYLMVASDDVSLVLGIKMLFPHTFRLYWYLTAYIMLYLIHGYLNNLVNQLSEKKLLFIANACAFYIIFSYFTRWYFSNVMTSWVLLYLLIGYIKRYAYKKYSDVVTTVVMFIIGIVGSIFVPIVLNWFCLVWGWNIRLNYFDDISRWNPFHILMAFALLNMAFNLKRIEISGVNMMAFLSPLVFVIHSNRVVREYFIPLIWHKLYEKSGGGIAIKSLLFGMLLYIVSLLLSYVYMNTLQKLTKRLSIRVIQRLKSEK